MIPGKPLYIDAHRNKKICLKSGQREQMNNECASRQDVLFCKTVQTHRICAWVSLNALNCDRLKPVSLNYDCYK